MRCIIPAVQSSSAIPMMLGVIALLLTITTAVQQELGLTPSAIVAITMIPVLSCIISTVDIMIAEPVDSLMRTALWLVWVEM